MRRGRFIKYDKQRVLEEIVYGHLSAQEIADKHGITRDMVYSLKHSAKKKNIIREPVLKVSDLHTPAEHDPSAPGRIFQLAKQYKEGKLDDLDFYQSVQKLLS